MHDNKLETILDKIYKLHAPLNAANHWEPEEVVCSHCEIGGIVTGEMFWQPYPCSTIKILEGLK